MFIMQHRKFRFETSVIDETRRDLFVFFAVMVLEIYKKRNFVFVVLYVYCLMVKIHKRIQAILLFLVIENDFGIMHWLTLEIDKVSKIKHGCPQEVLRVILPLSRLHIDISFTKYILK